MYNLAIVPAILFATRSIRRRREAWGAGVIAAFICITPAVLFHISFLGAYPGIVAQEIPVYWVLAELAIPILLILYIVGLFGTFIETGAGFVQGINERIDAYLVESRGVPLSKATRGLVAVVAIAMSAALATVGIIRLIAAGYGTIAWGFFAVYVVPVMTYGIYRIVTAGGPAAVSTSAPAQLAGRGVDHGEV